MHILLISAFMFSGAVAAGPQTAGDAERKLQAAIHEEVVAGNLQAALQQYKAIVDEHAADRTVTARALLQLGKVQQRLGRQTEARVTLARVAREYADQAEIAAQARSFAQASGAIGPKNLSFEQGEVGQVPPGWFAAVGKVELRRQGCRGSLGCAVVWLPEGTKVAGKPAQFGNIMQSFDATPYRGKTVRLRASLRLEASGPEDTAQMWFRVDRAERQVGSFDNMDDRPVKSSSWTPAEIVAKVQDDAARLNIGVMSVGKGRAWVDDLAFEIVADTTPSTGKWADRPLVGDAPQNLTFAEGEPGKTPPGWMVAGGQAELQRQGCHGTSACAAVWRTGSDAGSATLAQGFTAVPYRGKTVRVSGWLRMESGNPNDTARLWLRIERTGGRAAFMDNMDDRPVKPSAWTYAEIVGNVAADAATISFGVTSKDKGKAWVDGLTFEVVPDGTPLTVKPKVYPAEPQNLSLTQGEVGQVPVGWFSPVGSVSFQREGCRSASCAVVNPGDPFGNLMQQFSGARYRGKTIRVRAWLRLEAASSDDRAQMWFRVDRANETTGFFDHMSDRPVTSAQWTLAEIVGKIEPDALVLNVGVMTIGKGKAWVDGMTLEIVPDGTPTTTHYGPLGAPRNLNFAEGEAGKPPKGWLAAAGKSEWTRTGCRGSIGCAVVWLPSGSSAPFANLMQTIDATPYRDKTVRLRAWMRVASDKAPGRAQAWFRVDRAGRQMGFFDNMSDRPVTASQWTQVTIVGKIAADAEKINFGVITAGEGRAWVEDVILDVVPDSTPQTGPYLER